MKYHWILPLVSAALNIVLGVVVVSRAPRGRLNRVFLFMSVTLALWNLNNFVFYAMHDPAAALWWSKILRTGTVMMPCAVFHLVLTLVTVDAKTSRRLLGMSYGVSIALVCANTFGLLVTDVRQHQWGLYPVGTRLYAVYVVSVIVHCLAGLGLLIREYRTTKSPWQRQQARFWLLGGVVAMPAGFGNFLPIYGLPGYPTGHLGTVIYAAIIAYAIIRHRLMDIDLVITKGMAYAAGSIALIVPAFGAVLWLQHLSFGQIHTDFSFAVLVLLVAVGVFFPVLRLRAESQIERSLFRSKYEYRAALSAFAHSLTRILERDKLLRELADTLTNTFGLDRLALALLDQKHRLFRVDYATGIQPATAEFAETDDLIASLTRRRDLALREELEVSRNPVDRSAAEIYQRNGWAVCVPLTGSDQLIGFISLGQKRNLEAFFAEDLTLLSTIAAQASIALENARLYAELKKSRDIIERSGRFSALGTLAAGIAHEIRNPLVSIQTFFQLAPQRLNDKEFLTSFLGLTASEVQRISTLIDELLTFAKAPTHSLHDIDLGELIERTVLLLEPEARKRHVKLTHSLEPELPLVRADPDQIKQVVINLGLNAIQATDGGGAVTILTRRLERHEGVFCQIEIRDTGVGIPDKVLGEIFNPFFTTKDKGTGLGLSIAHQIVSEHGGFIATTSEEGRGSSFCVNLPTEAADSQYPSADSEVDFPPPYGRVAKL